MFVQRNKSDLFVERARATLERLYSVVISDRSLHIEIAATYCFVLQASSLTDEMQNLHGKSYYLRYQEKIH
jgi:hypothetical protein